LTFHNELITLLVQLGPLCHLALQTNPGRFILVDDFPYERRQTFA